MATSTSTQEQEAIAIIGYSCRFPGANTPDEFWSLLMDGVDATGSVPPDRRCASEIGKHIKRGGFLSCPVDQLDADFFRIPPKEAVYLDPQQRLFLEVTWEALENAGIDPHSLKGSTTGVYVGAWSNDYEKVLHSSSSGRNCEFHVAYLSNSLGAVAARISYFLNLHGPHGSMDAGCASSLYALAESCTRLRSGDCSMVICGGTQLILYPALSHPESMVFSPDGRCKTFDVKADGYGRAEGIASLVLKTVTKAQADGDKILGIIRSIATNCDTAPTTHGTPSKLAQSKVIYDAFKKGNVTSSQVSYLEAHGTGTPVGDAIEMQAVTAMYSDPKRKQPLVISSVKTNIGHAEAAAGMAGIIKVLLALKHNMIPPHINFNRLNPEINLDKIPAVIPLKAMPWTKSGDQPRIAALSSFALGGQNAHAILEEAPETTETTSLPLPQKSPSSASPPCHILSLSAKSDKALGVLLVKYKEFFETNVNNVTLNDICCSANTGRAQFRHRIFFTGTSLEEMSNNLTRHSEGSLVTQKCPTQSPKVAFIFPDHMVQWTSMCKTLYDTSTVFKMQLDNCTIFLENNLPGYSLLDVLFKNNHSSETSSPILPAVFSTQFALCQLWKSFGISPDFVLGYGTGELAAATAANILTLEDALLLVVAMVETTSKLPKGQFIALRTEESMAEKLLSQFDPEGTKITISGNNCSTETIVVTMEDESYAKEFTNFCFKNGVRSRKYFQGGAAMYTNLINEEMTGSQLEELIGQMLPNDSVCSFVSGSHGKVLGETHFKYDEEYWANLLRSKVNFASGMNNLIQQGAKVFVEVSCHPSLLGVAMSCVPSGQSQGMTWASSLKAGENSWTCLLTNLGKIYSSGVDINWLAFHAPFDSNKVQLPNYPFQRTPFWIDTL